MNELASVNVIRFHTHKTKVSVKRSVSLFHFSTFPAIINVINIMLFLKIILTAVYGVCYLEKLPQHNLKHHMTYVI